MRFVTSVLKLLCQTSNVDQKCDLFSMGYYAPVLWTYKWSKEETYVVGVAKTNVEIINVDPRNK
jgi:hypothetical protein